MKTVNGQRIFGREEEILKIYKILNSDKAEFFTMYGKRRVGKTFIINHTLSDYVNNHQDSFYLKLSGIYNSKNSIRIQRAFLDLQEFLFQNKSHIKDLDSLNFNFEKETWSVFFKNLEKLSELFNQNNKKLIVFIDELPWLVDRDGEFLSNFSLAWNQTFSFHKNFKLFVSGSATNWLIKKIIKDKGNLHRRLTDVHLLKPFSFDEHKEYLLFHNPNMSEYNIYLHYLIFGGVPYYLSLYNFNNSLEANVLNLFSSVLENEYDEIMSSLFSLKSIHRDLLSLMVNNKGMHSKDDLFEHLLKQNDRKITKQTLINNLEELVLCGFIKETKHFNNTSHNVLYRINDNFTYFYLKNIYKQKPLTHLDFNSQSFLSWTGHAFEIFLSNQIEFLKDKLGIKNLKTIDYCWNSLNDKNNQYLYSKNCQIDLIIERNDNQIHLIECKFYNSIFNVDEDYQNNLINKLNNFKTFLSTKKGYAKKDISVVLVSLYGSKMMKNNSGHLNYLDLKLI